VSSDIGIQIATLTLINHLLCLLDPDQRPLPTPSGAKEAVTKSKNMTVSTAHFSPSPAMNITNNNRTNKLMPGSDAPVADLEYFLTLFCDQLEILPILEKQTQIQSPELREQISIFQAFWLRRLAKSRSTNFDEKNPEHIRLLQRLWRVSFPDQNFPGVISEQWKDIGFQYKNPCSDLRSLGIHALEHLVFA